MQRSWYSFSLPTAFGLFVTLYCVQALAKDLYFLQTVNGKHKLSTFSYYAKKMNDSYSDSLWADIIHYSICNNDEKEKSPLSWYGPNIYTDPIEGLPGLTCLESEVSSFSEIVTDETAVVSVYPDDERLLAPAFITKPDSISRSFWSLLLTFITEGYQGTLKPIRLNVISSADGAISAHSLSWSGASDITIYIGTDAHFIEEKSRGKVLIRSRSSEDGEFHGEFGIISQDEFKGEIKGDLRRFDESLIATYYIKLAGPPGAEVADIVFSYSRGEETNTIYPVFLVNRRQKVAGAAFQMPVFSRQ